MNNQVSTTSNKVIYAKSGDDIINRKSVLFVMFLLWIMFIFYNSSETGNSSNERSYKITGTVVKGAEKVGVRTVTKEKFLKLNVLIRKLAHGFQFFVLAIILKSLISHSKVKKENIVFYTLLSIIFFASVDEFHQLFVSGRTPSVIDIIIDFSGGIVGVIVVIVINRLRNIRIEV